MTVRRRGCWYIAIHTRQLPNMEARLMKHNTTTNGTRGMGSSSKVLLRLDMFLKKYLTSVHAFQARNNVFIKLS